VLLNSVLSSIVPQVAYRINNNNNNKHDNVYGAVIVAKLL